MLTGAAQGSMERYDAIGMILMDLGFLDQMLGFRLKQAYHFLLKGGEARLSPLGIKPQDFSILAIVSQNPGIIQSRLIENLYITRSTCSEMVEQLIQAGFLKRVPIDRRSNGLFLTDKGESIFAQARNIIKVHTEAMTSHMEPDEIDTLIKLLARFSDHPQKDG